MDISPEEMTSAFTKALTDFHAGEQEESGDFYIPRKEHYEHHTFIGGLMEFVGITKKTIWKGVLTLFVMGLGTVIVTGTIAFIVLKSKGLM